MIFGNNFERTGFRKFKLKIDKERYTLLHDYFGERYSFRKHVDERWDEVEVTCVPQAIESWALQCSDYVEVLSPDELRDSIHKKCQNLLERYNSYTEN